MSPFRTDSEKFPAYLITTSALVLMPFRKLIRQITQQAFSLLITELQVDRNNKPACAFNDEKCCNQTQGPGPESLFQTDKKIVNTNPQKQQTPDPNQYFAHSFFSRMVCEAQKIGEPKAGSPMERSSWFRS